MLTINSPIGHCLQEFTHCVLLYPTCLLNIGHSTSIVTPHFSDPLGSRPGGITGYLCCIFETVEHGIQRVGTIHVPYNVDRRLLYVIPLYSKANQYPYW